MPDETIMNEPITSEEHLTAEAIAAYLDGTIGDLERKRVEAHAAECEECRREIVEVTGTLRRMRRTPNWRVWAPAAAAAALIAFLVLRPFWIETGQDSTSRFRGPESIAGREGRVDIRVLAPADESTVSPADVAFIWHAGGAEASYQLTLTDAEGGVVWTLATTDTVASLPDTIALVHASLYHWYVDGLLEDGRQASSGVRSFTTRR